MLNMDGNVKIADFGLAKIISTETTAEPSLTGTNIVMGTLDYLAPEQMVAGSTIDQRADLYAIGVLIYEMLTGQAPRGAFELPSKKVEGLDSRMDYVVVHAMASDPKDRYQSADELSTAILNIITPSPESDSKLELEPEPTIEPAPTPQAASGTPWESSTAKAMPLPDELKPVTQADIKAAVKEATLAATQAAQAVVQTSVNQKEPSTFWPNLYAAAKTVMTMGVVVLIVIVLGVITFFSWPRISRMITRTTSSTATATGTATATATATTIPPSTSTTGSG